MWADVRRFRSKLVSCPLMEDEAYLFGAATFPAYRGKDLAPYLRYKLYEHLYRMGRTKVYSITLALNYPAMRFNEKLQAKPLRLGLYICLFRKCRFDITLREYGTGLSAGRLEP